MSIRQDLEYLDDKSLAYSTVDGICATYCYSCNVKSFATHDTNDCL